MLAFVKHGGHQMMSAVAPQFDEHVSDPQVCKEMSVSAMALWRWDHDEEMIALGWPPPIVIKKRKYRSRKMLEQFKATMLKHAIEQRKRR
jgi:hypothetical protein